MAANININPSALSTEVPASISPPVPPVTVSNLGNAAIPPNAVLAAVDARFPPTRGAAPPAYFPRYYSAVPGGVPVPPPGQPVPGAQPPATMNPAAGMGPAVPQLTYMEGQLTTQAMLVEQQRRIKQLEAELHATRAEVQRLTAVANEARGNNNSNDNMNNANNSSLEKKPSSRYWTPDEHKRFLEGLELFGPRDIKAISRHVGTRSATQVRTHAQKYYLRIERERERAKASGTDPPVAPHQQHVYAHAPAKSPISTQTNAIAASNMKSKVGSPRKRSSRHRSRYTNANKPPPQPDEGKTNGGNLYTLHKKAANINSNITPTPAGKKLPFEQQRKRSHPSSNLLQSDSNEDMTIPISMAMPMAIPVPIADNDGGSPDTSRRVKPRTDPEAKNEDDGQVAVDALTHPKIEPAAEPISGTGAGGLLSNANGNGNTDAADIPTSSGTGALPRVNTVNTTQPSLVGMGSIPFVPSSGALLPPFATSSSLALHQVPSSNTLDRALASYVNVPASLPQVPSVSALGTLMSSRDSGPLPRVSSTTGLLQVASSGALQLPRVASSLTAAWNGALAADKAALAADRTKSSGSGTVHVSTQVAASTGLRRSTESGTLRRVDSTASIGLGRGLARTNSILSLLSGLPTAGVGEAVTGSGTAAGTVTTPGNSIRGGNNIDIGNNSGNGGGGRTPFETMELDEDPSKWPADS